jgi:succinate-semialdehyde dehydrogenase/glutarate-semialdehyde dehydrogenase
MYSDVQLFIGGRWQDAADGRTLPVVNPATEEVIGQVAHAGRGELDAALAAAESGFRTWKAVSAFERARIFRKAAQLLESRAEAIARLMMLEQGKPVADALAETLRGAETIEWMAGEAQRAYGRVIPARAGGVTQLVVKEPIGPVAAFTPWNFPINQMVRKIAGALAAGCSIIVKGPEETPASCAELVRVFEEAGVSPGAVNLVYGAPAEISGDLIPHPVIRKVSFTGSTVVGKQLAALAGQHMKPVTMELGGHGPVLVFEDAPVDVTVKIMAANKWRNAGQTCINPTRFIVHEQVYEPFVEAFIAHAKAQKVGPGDKADTTMGPMANPRRIQAMEDFVADAVTRGGQVRTGGKRIGNVGNFFEPTVLTDVPTDARVMNEEPFGPLALISAFASTDEAVAEANRLPYGLAAYAFTRSPDNARIAAERVAAAMVSINHFGLGMPETPFGGLGDSGYGFEGGAEAIEPYLQTRFVTTGSL